MYHPGHSHPFGPIVIDHPAVAGSSTSNSQRSVGAFHPKGSSMEPTKGTEDEGFRWLVMVTTNSTKVPRFPLKSSRGISGFTLLSEGLDLE